MRPLLALLHRWFGLASCVFLFVAGATGSLIAWDHELDAWLNPRLFDVREDGRPASGPLLSGVDLAEKIEAADPRVRVTYLPIESERNRASLMSVESRMDPSTGRPFALGFDQVMVNPFSGNIQGRRQWGKVSLRRENLIPFLYKLHYTMQIPDGWGIQLGTWLMGIIGMAWVLDCFVALWLSFPSLRSWRKSFAFRWRQGGYRLTFDLHRSGGVWIWGLLLIIALTSVSMNLNREVMRPLVARFSVLSPDVFDTRVPHPPIAPEISRTQILAAARAEAARRGWKLPPGGMFYSSAYGIYGIGFFKAGNDHGDGGLGNAWLYFDGNNGRLVNADIPGSGSAGDIFLQAQFPLHSGRILGVAGRILVSVLGVLVATLSLTGLLIWLRKRRARRK